MLGLLVVAFFLSALPAAATPPELGLPIDCRPGGDCWIVRYMDHDPGSEAVDYRCGRLSGDGHKGTDFAIPDLAAMARGVVVRAAAAGVVDALRDGVPDTGIGEGGREAIAGRECGNGIRLAHGDGWTSWYCHLRRGSLLVAEGDRVVAGQALAMVGLSGDTSFPHLHFDLRRDGQAVDPFLGLTPPGSCTAGERPLWRDDVLAGLVYQPVVMAAAGFAPAAPTVEDARRGWYRQPTQPVTIPVLVLWVDGYWIEAGDVLRFRIAGPAGAVLDRSFTADKGFRRWFRFAGARRPGERWPPGTYHGEIILERSRQDLMQRKEVTIELR